MNGAGQPGVARANDGDIDIVVNNADGPAQLLLNQRGAQHPWLIIRAAEGARVDLEFEDDSTASRRASSGGGYLSAPDPRVHFGLGERKPKEAVVSQPDGKTRRKRLEGLSSILDLRGP